MLGSDLPACQDDEKSGGYGGTQQVAHIHRHGDRVAAGLAQRSRGNLDDPEGKGNFRYLAEAFFDDGVQ